MNCHDDDDDDERVSYPNICHFSIRQALSLAGSRVNLSMPLGSAIQGAHSRAGQHAAAVNKRALEI